MLMVLAVTFKEGFELKKKKHLNGAWKSLLSPGRVYSFLKV